MASDMGVHVRVRGWCDRCQGPGRLGVGHVDAKVTEEEALVADVEHIRRDTLKLVDAYVRRAVEARRAELAFGNGCEAAAARAFEDGRLAVIERDMWAALSVTPPGGLLGGSTP